MGNAEKKLKAIVFGGARSGVAASKLLARENYEVILADENTNPKAINFVQELSALQVSCRFGNVTEDILDNVSLFIISPGIPFTHPLVQKAVEKKIEIISELELGSRYIHGRIAAITGTNGKTTVTTLINKILIDAGITSLAAGNIGYAICEAALREEARYKSAVFSIEVSSFQLEQIKKFKPSVSIITNITPDHMDRYNTFEDYKNAKFNITMNNSKDEYIILNSGCPYCREFAGKTTASVQWVSLSPIDSKGAYLEDGKIWINDDKKIYLMDTKEIPVMGMHNVENVLCSALAAYLLGVSPDIIRKSVMDFKGVEHRIEFSGEKNNIRYYNDSKATNLDSLRVALKSFEQPIILIAGGRSKETTYNELSDLVKQHVKFMITLGEKAETLEKEWGGIVEYKRAISMDNAVEMAMQIARPGEVVLFSPGHKSFDMYNNYEERGKDFKQCVKRRLEL